MNGSCPCGQLTVVHSGAAVAATVAHEYCTMVFVSFSYFPQYVRLGFSPYIPPNLLVFVGVWSSFKGTTPSMRVVQRNILFILTMIVEAR